MKFLFAMLNLLLMKVTAAAGFFSHYLDKANKNDNSVKKKRER